jgi:hypothetical protein
MMTNRFPSVSFVEWRKIDVIYTFSALFRLSFVYIRIYVQGETLIFFTSAFLAREQKTKTKESNNRTERPATVPVSCCRRCYS